MFIKKAPLNLQNISISSYQHSHYSMYVLCMYPVPLCIALTMDMTEQLQHYTENIHGGHCYEM